MRVCGKLNQHQQRLSDERVMREGREKIDERVRKERRESNKREMRESDDMVTKE